MNAHKIIGFLSTLALFSPVVVMLSYRLIQYKKYLPLFFYCLFAFVYNLMSEGYLPVAASTQRTFGIVNNLLDPVLMLTFLIFFHATPRHANKMKWVLLVLIVSELIILAVYGLSIKTITLVVGPGLVIVFIHALYFFVQTVKRCFFNNKIMGKALIATAISFAYGCFFLIYIMHYVMALPDVDDIFLIYFISTIIFSSLLTAGLVLESKRHQKMEELRITREELMQFFADEKKTVIPSEPAHQWKAN